MEKIALMQRGQCMFAEKARNIQKAGAIGGIVIGKLFKVMQTFQCIFSEWSQAGMKLAL